MIVVCLDVTKWLRYIPAKVLMLFYLNDCVILLLKEQTIGEFSSGLVYLPFGTISNIRQNTMDLGYELFCCPCLN